MGARSEHRVPDSNPEPLAEYGLSSFSTGRLTTRPKWIFGLQLASCAQTCMSFPVPGYPCRAHLRSTKVPNRRSKRYRGPPAEQGNNRGAKYPTAEQEGSATDEGGWVGAFAFRPRAHGTLSTLAEAATPARASLRIGRADHLERHGRFDDAAKPSCDDSPSATHELQAHRRSRKTP